MKSGCNGGMGSGIGTGAPEINANIAIATLFCAMRGGEVKHDTCKEGGKGHDCNVAALKRHILERSKQPLRIV